MEHEQFVKFCKEIIKLKEQLKCPICLEIIQDTAELSCGHKFCNNCQTTLKDINRRSICPLCKAKITRRSHLFKDEIADKLGFFVSKICNKLENNQGCTVDEIVHGFKNPLQTKENKLVAKENQTNVETNESTPVKTSSKHYSEKDNQPSTLKKCVDKLPKKQSIVQKVAHNTDIRFKSNGNEESSDTSKKKILKSLPEIYNKSFSKKLHEKSNTSALEEKPSTSKEIVFDKLTKKHCQDLLLNKRGTKFNYTRTKNKVLENDDYKILDFDNDDTKMSVLRWLNDNKNKFNRLTQTQANNEEESNMSSDVALLDLHSISQVNHHMTNPLKIHVSRKTRARSLDIEKKENVPKRLSDVGLRENYEIENNTEDVLKKAEEAVILRIIEDKYLGDIEEQMQNNEKQTTLQKNDGRDIEHHPKQHSVSERGKLQKEIDEGKENKKKIGPKTKGNEHNTTQSSTSGWVRVNEVLRKKGKQAKKLNVTLESSHNTTEKKNSTIGSVENLNNRSYTNDRKLDKEQTVPTKLQNSGQDSNKENIENVFNLIDAKPNISILGDIVINKANTVQEHKTDVTVQNTNMDIEDADVYELPTQKLFDSEEFKSQQINQYEAEPKLDTSSILNDLCSKLNSFDEVMNDLMKNLGIYLEQLDDGKKITKKHIKSIQKYLEKLNDFYGADCNKIPTSFIDQAVQIESVMCQNFTQTENVFCCDAEVQTVEITEPSQKPKLLKKLSGTGKYEDKLIAKKIPALKKTQSDAFGQSLDILNFETQELEKQYLLKNKNKSTSNKKSQKEVNKTQNIPINKTQDLPANKTNKSSLNLDDDDDEPLKENSGVLVISLKSDCVNDKSQKRPMSDSESSDIVLSKKRTKRMCNRFIRDDLSIEFGSSEKPKTEKTAFSPDLSTDDEDNDEEFLNGILKKYGSDIPLPIKDDKNEKEDSNKKVEENVQHISSESVYKTATNSYDDDVMFNDDNLSKLDNEVRLLTEHKGDTEISDVIEGTESSEHIPKRPTLERMNTNVSDVIPETEDIEPLPKRPKLVLNTDFNKGVQNENVLHTEENPSSPVKIINKGTFCPELEDSFDGVDFENIAEELMDNVGDLKQQKRLKEDTHAQKSNEDDLFSDEDVVETTPQKAKFSAEKRSQNNFVANLSSLFLPSNNAENAFAEDLDLDFIPLAPPPGFGDENADDTTPENFTVISLEPKAIEEDKVTTPVKSSSFYQINIGPVTPLNIAVQKLPHSTPRTQLRSQKESTLGLSPIPREKNIFEKAFESSDTIISVLSQSSTQKRNMLTSNPKQKSILNYVKPPSSPPKPCIACTRLGKDQIQSISLLTNKKLATYSAKFSDSVTHMIVAVDEKRRIKDYTMKFVAAVASGIWVLCYEWIQECLKANTIVPEDAFEVLDDSGKPGPKTARLTKNENPLFKDFWFFCVRPLYSISVEDIEDVITKLGGVTVRNLESFSLSEGKINLIITEGRSTQDFEIYERWLEKYKIVTVDIEWLSRCVGRYKILSIKPYIWCSDDSVDDLGYPNYLTEVTSSCVSELS